MLFNSLAFALFLPLVFVAYWMLRGRAQVQNALLVVASYVFYAWWDWRFLGLIVLVSGVSFVSGMMLGGGDGEEGPLAAEPLGTRHSGEREDERQRREGRRLGKAWQRMVLVVAVAVQVGILGVFKYLDFFGESVAALVRMMGGSADWATVGLVLPVGISFYTFQALSYTIDVYRGRIAATRDIVAFFAYISFFPQLVAGPIERATSLLPQMLGSRRFDYGEAVSGLRLMLTGYVKKVVVADTCALAVDSYWSEPSSFGSWALLLSAVLFSFQIYCDFSGYSDIAVGTARLFGIRLSENFRRPYLAADIVDFWRRWHVSLMTWLRDYVYIPLGGNRLGERRRMLNTLAVFLVSGLWHGASWTFVVWGGYHALLFVPGRGMARRRAARNATPEVWGRDEESGGEGAMGNDVAGGRDGMRGCAVARVAGVMLTFCLVAFGWIIFRAPDMGAFLGYVAQLCTGWGETGVPYGKTCIGWVALLMAAEVVVSRTGEETVFTAGALGRSRGLRWCAYYVGVALLLFCHGAQQSFIYFQF